MGAEPAALPALGGLVTGLMALAYPEVLYQGFGNVNAVLDVHGQVYTAWLLSQIVVAKVVATAVCRGSGLVGGLYAPSIFTGASSRVVLRDACALGARPAWQGQASLGRPCSLSIVRAVGHGALQREPCPVRVHHAMLWWVWRIMGSAQYSAGACLALRPSEAGYQQQFFGLVHTRTMLKHCCPSHKQSLNTSLVDCTLMDAAAALDAHIAGGSCGHAWRRCSPGVRIRQRGTVSGSGDRLRRC